MEFCYILAFQLYCRETLSNPEEPLDDDSLNPSEDQKTLYFLRNASQNKSNEEKQKKFSLERDNLQRHLVHDIIVSSVNYPMRTLSALNGKTLLRK